jgi:hypothetical protein
LSPCRRLTGEHNAPQFCSALNPTVGIARFSPCPRLTGEHKALRQWTRSESPNLLAFCGIGEDDISSIPLVLRLMSAVMGLGSYSP